MFLKKMFGDKPFYKMLFALSLPIAFQQLLGTALNMIDTLMISKLGEIEVAAVGIANQPIFILQLFFFGLSGGAATFIARFWGKRDMERIQLVLWMTLGISLGVVVLASVLLFAFAKPIIALFNQDAKIIEIGSSYLRIVLFSNLMMGITQVFATALRSTEEVKLPTAVSILAVVVNTVLNYLLIFGVGALPALGVTGAAVATVIARAVELFLLVFMTYHRKYEVRLRPVKRSLFTRSFAGSFLKTALPVMANECLWALGSSVYVMIYNHMGTTSGAAYQIFSIFERLGTLFFIGIGNAAMVILGIQLGKGDRETAYLYAKRMMAVVLMLGIALAVVLFFLVGPITSLFQSEQFNGEVLEETRAFCYAFLLWMPIKAYTLLMILGVLRGGGDTRYSMFLDVGTIWVCGLPLAALAGPYLGLSVFWVYLISMSEELLRTVIVIPRFRSRKWMKKLTSDA